MRKPQNKILVACLSIVVTAIIGYVGKMVYEDWRAAAPYRAEAAKQRHVFDLRHRVNDAERLLETYGVKLAKAKGFSRKFDLSSFDGKPKELQPLQTMLLLREIGPGNQVNLQLKLGPRIDDTFLPLLLSLETLEVLEIGESPLSDSAKQQLKDHIPGLKFEAVRAFE